MKRVVLFVAGVVVGFTVVAVLLTSCYHGNPPWPGPDPTQPTPIFTDPCMNPDPFGGYPCPLNSYMRKSDGGADRQPSQN